VLNDQNFDGFLRVDRASIRYTDDALTLKLGRQAISWGNGLIFNTYDLFNPFSPADTDKDFKSGDDMVYGQWLFPSGDDLQLLTVPRRRIENGNISDERSSFAAKYRGALEEIGFEYDLLLAQHFDELVGGIGISGELIEAVWRIDFTLTDLNDDSLVTSVVANLDRSWVILDHNVYGFIEYFFSGVGVDENRYTSPPTRLADRVQRNELFTLGRNYLAVGGRIEVNPLFNLFVTDFTNLDDHSGLVQVRSEWNVSDSVSIFGGFNIPYGDGGSEFGGIELEDSVTLGLPKLVYLRVGYFY